jgi:hypothetical protein
MASFILFVLDPQSGSEIPDSDFLARYIHGFSIIALAPVREDL